MIREIFCGEEAQEILSRPVSLMRTKDRLVWTLSPNGQFSVAAGYKLAKLMKQQGIGDEGPSSRRDENEEKL